VSDLWRSDVDQLYAGYAIYAQSGGADQAVFEPSTGQAGGRSRQLLRALQQRIELGSAGCLLDVGCGNGAFLQAVHDELAGWRLTGTELDDRHAASLARLGSQIVPTATPWLVPGQFDLVSLIHVAEHIPAPVQWLTALRTKLRPDGRLLVQVPTFAENPFDLVVADHCSHFTAGSARAVLCRAGFAVEMVATDWIPKEVSLLAHIGPVADERVPADGAFARAVEGVAWLQRLLAMAKSLAAVDRLGVFGTSIAGTWLGSQLGDRLAFFVDEDPQRIGRCHLDRPVLAPVQVPADTHVILALPDALARSVARRLGGEARDRFQCHLLAVEGA
jgi:SAM-dependent methyltransferase